MLLNTLRIVCLSAAIAAGAAGADAQSIFGAEDELPARVALHSGWAEPDGRRIAGLRMDLEPGWKTYWRAPGATGIPPHFDWSGSENVKSLNIVWPAPQVFQSFGARTIGYSGDMTLPLSVTAEDPAAPIRLRLSLFYGLCEEICIPARADLALDIEPGSRPQGAFFIEDALAAAPRPAREAGVVSAVCDVVGADAIRDFTASIEFGSPLAAAPVVVAEAPDGARIEELAARIEDGRVVAAGALRTAAGAWVDRSSIRLTLIDGDASVDVLGCSGAD